MCASANHRAGGIVLGQRVNNYEIVKLLGEGGMGAVYEAEHRVIRRRVAIKVLKPELALDRELVQRFFNEARATSAIHHPNIVEIVDVGMLREGVPYLVMELLEGENLCDRITRCERLEIAMAIEIVQQAASALEAAHQSGIVHRDLKPENLFIVRDPRRGLGEVVKVLDFGIAKLRDDLTTVPVHTLAGAVLGTPPYMSPEQCRGRERELDQRTDIYSLGVILYEAICGVPPFLSDAIVELLVMHMNEPPPPPSQRRFGLAPALEAVILKALEKQPSARFQSMAELGSALAALPEDARTVDGERRVTPQPSAAAQPAPPRMSIRRQPRRAYDPLCMPDGVGESRAQLGLDTTRSSQPDRAYAFDANAARDQRTALPEPARALALRNVPSRASPERSSPGSDADAIRSASFAVSSSRAPTRTRRASYAWLWAVAIPMVVLAVGDRPGPRARLTTQLHAAQMSAAARPPLQPSAAGDPRLGVDRAPAPITVDPPHDANAGALAPSTLSAASDAHSPPAAPSTRANAATQPATVRAHSGEATASKRAAVGPASATAPPPLTAAAPPSERVTGARFAIEAMPNRRDSNPYRTPPPPSAADEPRPDGVEPGYLSLDTAPWSEVFLGDTPLGTTPLLRVPLPPGKHLLTLRNSELSTSTTYAVDIQSGQTVSRLIGWGR